MAFWLISSSSELKHIFSHINRVGVRIGPAFAFCSHNLTAHVGPLYERAKANAGPVSLAHKGLPLPHCMQDILPSNLRKNFSYLAFWPCPITASHSKTVSQSGPLMKLTHIMSRNLVK